MTIPGRVDHPGQETGSLSKQQVSFMRVSRGEGYTCIWRRPASPEEDPRHGPHLAPTPDGLLRCRPHTPPPPPPPRRAAEVP